MATALCALSGAGAAAALSTPAGDAPSVGRSVAPAASRWLGPSGHHPPWFSWGALPVGATPTDFHAGFFGQILMSTSAGELLFYWDADDAWEVVASGLARLNAVDFVDTGYSGFFASSCAVGDDGTIVYQPEGVGAPWTRAASGTTASLLAVDCVGLDRVWAVGAGGTILRSADYGATWRAQDSGVSIALRGVSFAGSRRGWAVGDGGTILATTDGKTWHAQTSPVATDLRAVYFAGPSRGWACGDGGVVLSTVDGGETWVVHQTPLGGDATALCFWGVRRGWVVDELGEVVHTRDGGRTWSLQQSGLTSGGVGIEFISHATGLVASGDQLMATAVGGWPDTRGPVTTAYPHRPATRGSRVTLWFQVADEQCDWLPRLRIELRHDGHTVLRLPAWDGIGTETGGGRFGQSFVCGLRPGWYRFYVHATDASGNKESRAGWNLLHVVRSP